MREEPFLRATLADLAAQPGQLLVIDQHGSQRWVQHGAFAAKLLAEPANDQWADRTVRFAAAARDAVAWRNAGYEWPAYCGG